jgi:hypothetical protein
MHERKLCPIYSMKKNTNSMEPSLKSFIKFYRTCSFITAFIIDFCSPYPGERTPLVVRLGGS